MSRYRIIVVFLLAVSTACMVCSCLFPIFRSDSNGPSSKVSAYYYWYRELGLPAVSGVRTIERAETRSLESCDQVYFLTASILAVAAAAFGGLATLLGAAWVPVVYNVSVGVTVFLLTFIAFACSAVVVCFMSLLFAVDFSQKGECGHFTSSAHFEYNLVEGFYLLCIAVAGFLGLTITQAIGFCCGCQVRRPERCDDSSEVPHSPMTN
ncbi:hypothetical protein ABL78_6229 [Leptomonas seymouri]|uniref:Amastin-like surface protein-like protein n=1 Tax=Leptomonas seymouri TaxID=5684 RepID=A0A0N0P4D5_LEPSE|nr:hypothetical protein ABL78_6229 [Leptomonas seymouri]|eukprot:KPI84707.1 hypothetical protein ABL78_6229 [Leptomonas seymouri]